MTDSIYQKDLAYVHDQGFSEFAKTSGAMILEELNARFGKEKGEVLDLGCGGGALAKILTDNGYQVEGIDISSDLIEIAKEKVPNARFTSASFFEVLFPKGLQAVVSTSECFNYVPTKEHSLLELFQEVFHSLQDGGVFLFDMLEPGKASDSKGIYETDEWTMFVHTVRDPKEKRLTRDVTLFRKCGDLYRKSTETHQARLYPREEVLELLRKVGFKAEAFCKRGQLVLDEGHMGYLAEKKG